MDPTLNLGEQLDQTLNLGEQLIWSDTRQIVLSYNRKISIDYHSFLNQTSNLKGTVSVISCDPQCKNANA